MPVAKVTQDGVTISILSSDGVEIHAKDNALKLVFQDSAGNPVETEHLKLELNMNMPGMVVHTGAQIKRDSGMGDFHAQLTPNMTGDWTADVSYRGPQGPASVTVPLNVKH